MTNKTLQCIFYSHSWTALLLNKIDSIDFSYSVLIELSNHAILSQVFLQESNKQSSLIQILAHHQSFKQNFAQKFLAKNTDILQSLSQHYHEMPAPLIFAPQNKATALNQIEAIKICVSEASVFQQIIVLIHYQEAQDFVELYDYIDKFYIFWDIADLPTVKLTELSQLLVEQPLTQERWGGFHCCHHPHRYLQDLEQREAFFQSAIDNYLPQF